MAKGLNVIITGSTGMVGRSTLNECLVNDKIAEILVINRRPVGIMHPKLKEIIHLDFSDFSSLENELPQYDACFHCMGVSSVGKNEAEFTKYTYDVTKSLVDTCYAANPDMVFNYVSGAGTDASAKGKIMWARVKGKTENYVLNKGFKDAYMFRLGALLPEGDVSSGTSWYKYIYSIMKPFYPIMKKLKSVTTSSKFGKAMINSIAANQDLKYLEGVDINYLATKE
ncbi:NAD-dependent epimerase/dehydratase family protein [Maribacter ulvicola]|uniref:NAD dependent epimerase/dehydratase family protein n=1 Tax=Maribacter ulvicola TaxID=228959 RepID=A0A1N6UE67_9FLAO|nr:NAD-dependent epimerase/dehydratase family protein [Maribacter ulvicola]SIQ63890.1 NAD dependent epimerase/dehydratase family protein [Maribacter ulvicola]